MLSWLLLGLLRRLFPLLGGSRSSLKGLGRRGYLPGGQYVNPVISSVAFIYLCIVLCLWIGARERNKPLAN
jgi:hypothetical protein